MTFHGGHKPKVDPRLKKKHKTLESAKKRRRSIRKVALAAHDAQQIAEGKDTASLLKREEEARVDAFIQSVRLEGGDDHTSLSESPAPPSDKLLEGGTTE